MQLDFSKIDQCAGVGLRILGDRKYRIAALIVARKKQHLHFIKKFPELTTISELERKLPLKSLVALNLSGKGILYKSVDKLADINALNFKGLLPNAEIQDFYVQHFTSGERSFVAVIRKADADPIIQTINDGGMQVVALSLGPYPLANIIDQVNLYGTEVLLDSFIISRNENGSWMSVNYKESQEYGIPLKIENEPLDERLILPYAAAFQILLNNQLNAVAADVKEVDAVLKQVITRNKVTNASVAFLFSFFILLLINFFLLSELNKRNTALTEKMLQTTKSTSELEMLTKRIARNETMIKSLGWDGGINKSILISQLARLSPGEITWSKVELNPIDVQRSNLQKSISFADHKILVSGISDRIIPVNEWIARVKTKSWVKNIQLENYNFNAEEKVGSFKVSIDY